MNQKPKIIAVVGPTASGKTALSVALAKALGGEVLSCDSMQIYRDMDIGTAKPTMEEREGVPHHLIDIAAADEPFSCAEYAALAKQTVGEVIARGKLPIFCGGTGLYLDGVLRGGNSYEKTETAPEYRAELERIAVSRHQVCLAIGLGTHTRKRTENVVGLIALHFFQKSIHNLTFF